MFCIYCGKEIPDGTVCPCRKQAEASETKENLTSAPFGDFGYRGAEDGAENNNTQGSSMNNGLSSGMDNGHNNGFGSGMDNGYNNGFGSGMNNGYNNGFGSGMNNGYYNGMPQPSYTNPAMLSDRHMAVKKALGSPLALIAAVFYTAGVVLSVFQSFSLSIFSVLIIIGIWITYSSAHKPYAPAKTGGLTLFSGVLIAQIVFMILAYLSVAAILGICALFPEQLNSEYSYISRYLNINYNFDMPASINVTSGVFVILIVVWTCMAVFGIFYYATLRTSITSIRAEINGQPSNHKISVFPMVMLIINGIVSIAGGIITIMTLDEQSRIVNSILEKLFEEAEIQMEFTYHASVLGPAGVMLTAIAMIFSAFVFLGLRSKLKKTNKQ